MHPRPDQRHVRPDDVRALAAMLRGRVEYNIEGNPFAGPRGDYPGLIALARQVRPTQVTLVPDGDGQLTSDHGFDLRQDTARLRPLVGELNELGCRVSLFVDAGSRDFDLAAVIGVQRIEIYTGPYAQAFADGDPAGALAACAETAPRAQQAGLAVNAWTRPQPGEPGHVQGGDPGAGRGVDRSRADRRGLVRRARHQRASLPADPALRVRERLARLLRPPPSARARNAACRERPATFPPRRSTLPQRLRGLLAPKQKAPPKRGPSLQRAERAQRTSLKPIFTRL
ncbi:Pyridoxine 5'-phosphate synthase [Rhodanobacter lindaniclasticus]